MAWEHRRGALVAVGGDRPGACGSSAPSRRSTRTTGSGPTCRRVACEPSVIDDGVRPDITGRRVRRPRTRGPAYAAAQLPLTMDAWFPMLPERITRRRRRPSCGAARRVLERGASARVRRVGRVRGSSTVGEVDVLERARRGARRRRSAPRRHRRRARHDRLRADRRHDRRARARRARGVRAATHRARARRRPRRLDRPAAGHPRARGPRDRRARRDRRRRARHAHRRSRRRPGRMAHRRRLRAHARRAARGVGARAQPAPPGPRRSRRAAAHAVPLDRRGCSSRSSRSPPSCCCCAAASRRRRPTSASTRCSRPCRCCSRCSRASSCCGSIPLPLARPRPPQRPHGATSCRSSVRHAPCATRPPALVPVLAVVVGRLGRRVLVGAARHRADRRRTRRRRPGRCRRRRHRHAVHARAARRVRRACPASRRSPRSTRPHRAPSRSTAACARRRSSWSTPTRCGACRRGARRRRRCPRASATAAGRPTAYPRPW